MRLLVTAVLISQVSCCIACTVWRMSGAGFAAGVNSLFLAYPIFFGTNGTFYLDTRDMHYSCSSGVEGWQKGLYDYFQLNHVHRWTPALENELGGSCAIKDHSSINDIVEDIGVPYSELQAQAALQLWRPQLWLQKLAADRLANLKQFEPPTLVFHIRGGDKVHEDVFILKRKFTTPDMMVETAKEEFPLVVQNATCIIIGYDPSLNKELAEKLGALGCKVHHQRPLETLPPGGHSQKDFTDAPLSVRCNRTVELLLDIIMMGNADYFVGSYHSGIAGLVDILRFTIYGKSRATFADASAEHRDPYTGLRKKFPRSELKPV